jgi:hypothetical protein
MKQLKLVLLACLALFVLTGVFVSSASAGLLPEILPLVEGRNFTDENDGAPPQLVSTEEKTAPIECTGATSTGTEEAKKPLGSYHITFKGCKTEEGGLKVSCNSEGDAKEVILNLGTWHLVFDQEKPELLTATLFLPEHTTIICAGFVKILVLGMVLCLDLPLLADKRHFLFHCTQKGGVADEKLYFNAGDVAGDNGKVKLECKKGAGVYLECAELALGLVLYEKEVTLDI